MECKIFNKLYKFGVNGFKQIKVHGNDYLCFDFDFSTLI